MNLNSNNIELDVINLHRNLRSGFYRLLFNGLNLPVRYRQGFNDTMIVIFHGAIDQSQRKMPHFQSLLPELKNCHQISIADPTLALDPSIKSGWYLGGESMPLQMELPNLLRYLSELNGVNKRIYLGGSSGGFAALYYSLMDPGSVCIAVNPQTRLTAYLPNPVKNFLKYAWPDAKSIENVGHQLVTDLPAAYAKGFANMVIYLQSTGDLLHFTTQMPAFCDAGLKKPEQFILNCGYWGIPGHSNSVPSKEYYMWVKAVVAAKWFDRQSILDNYHLIVARTAAATHNQSQQLREKVVTTGEVLLADQLRDYHLCIPNG